MLTVEDLRVEVGGKTILKHIDLEIQPGEIHVMFGPNGSGKTSLLLSIMGYPGYTITAGKIVFRGEDITNLPVHERARRGIGISYQRPPTIHGLKTRYMVEICGRKRVNVDGLAKKVNFSDFLDRDINEGFSGGEIKRSELLQLMAQDPDLVLLDEPESGVDLENIALIGETINSVLQRVKEHNDEKSQKEIIESRSKSGLLITHTGHILDYVPADKGQILYDGVLACMSNPRNILECIRKFGYEECLRCSL
jgi:Fe-S cluster assembly ATP-binding protein